MTEKQLLRNRHGTEANQIRMKVKYNVHKRMNVLFMVFAFRRPCDTLTLVSSWITVLSVLQSC